MFGVIMPLCNRMFCCIFGWYFYIEIRLKYEKIFCCPALELSHCLPLWKTVLFVSSRAFSCLPLWKTVRLHGKKLQNATNRLNKWINIGTNIFVVFITPFWNLRGKLKSSQILSDVNKMELPGWFWWQKIDLTSKSSTQH